MVWFEDGQSRSNVTPDGPGNALVVTETALGDETDDETVEVGEDVVRVED